LGTITCQPAATDRKLMPCFMERSHVHLFLHIFAIGFLNVIHYYLGLEYHLICKEVEDVRLCYAVQDRHKVLCVVMAVKAEELKT
jgi:hypothetical protein